MSFNVTPPPPPFKHIRDEARKAPVLVLRARVAPILATNLLHHFTDHSVAHSDSLTLFIDQLIEPLQAGSHALNEQELLVLYSACYLHDIGMQYENAGTTQAISKLSLPQRWEDLSQSTRETLIRQHHAEISAEMVAMSIRAEAPLIGFQLTTEYQPSYVAALCEAHTLPTDSERYLELTREGPNMRMALLSGLLRIADILDLSRRRATRERARTLVLDIESQTHWWRHHYTEEITLDPSQRLVCLWFDFPTDRLPEYSRIVPQLQMPWVEAEFTRQMAVFHRYGLGWSVTYKVEQKPFTDAEVMPEAVLTEMVKELNRRRREEEERHRLVVAQQFVEAQPQIDRRLRDLESRRDTLPAGDYLRELSRMAFDLSELGGKRSAWMLLVGEFERGAAGLEDSERLELGMRLAAMMVEDREAKRATWLTNNLITIADALPDGDERKFAFWSLRARSLTNLGAHEEAVAAAERAAALAPDEAARAEVEADLSELQFLSGHIEQALATAAPSGGAR